MRTYLVKHVSLALNAPIAQWYPPERTVRYGRGAVVLYVYRIRNPRWHYKKLYKGLTKDLERRLDEHIKGKTRSTKGMKDIRVVYTENCDTLLDARKREVYLKSAAGRRFLKDKLPP